MDNSSIWNKANEQGMIDPRVVLAMHEKVTKSPPWDDSSEEKALRNLAEVYQRKGLTGRFISARTLECSTDEANQLYEQARKALSEYGLKYFVTGRKHHRY